MASKPGVTAEQADENYVKLLEAIAKLPEKQQVAQFHAFIIMVRADESVRAMLKYLDRLR